MGLFNFIKEAGEKLFGGEAQAAAPTDAAAANARAGEAISKYIASLQLATADLSVSFDGATSTVAVAGTAPDQATKEKILLAAGNVAGSRAARLVRPCGVTYRSLAMPLSASWFARSAAAWLSRPGGFVVSRRR